MYKTGLKKLIQNKRQLLTIVSAVFIVSVLLVAGIFSYFRSSDAVTNKLTAQSGSLTVREPKWDSEGKNMAAASEPGMKIPKDPYALNNGNIDLYIRLKLKISLGTTDVTGKTDAYKATYGSYTDAQRLRPIAEALKLTGLGDTVTPLLTLTAEGDVKDWKTSCNNPAFVTDGSNHSGSSSELVFCFYYTNGKEQDGKAVMQAVGAGETTKELFRQVDIPEYKKDWLGVFDQKYTITIEAEGIPAGRFPEGLTAEAAPAEFESSGD